LSARAPEGAFRRTPLQLREPRRHPVGVHLLRHDLVPSRRSASRTALWSDRLAPPAHVLQKRERVRIGDEPAKGGEDRTAVARVRIEECGHAAQEVGGGGGSLGAAEGGREDAEGCGVGGRAVSGGEESGGGARVTSRASGEQHMIRAAGWRKSLPNISSSSSLQIRI